MTKVLAIGCMTFFLCHLFPNQREKGEERRFIVGFELSAEKGMSLVWPLQAMPPSGYRSVLMVIEKMPRIYEEGGESKPWQYLSVYRYLSVNGQALPDGKDALTEVPTFPQEFIVDLREGRLKLFLTVPSGWSVDPRHKAAVIKLFEVPLRGPTLAHPLIFQDERSEIDLSHSQAGETTKVDRMPYQKLERGLSREG